MQNRILVRLALALPPMSMLFGCGGDVPAVDAPATPTTTLSTAIAHDSAPPVMAPVYAQGSSARSGPPPAQPAPPVPEVVEVDPPTAISATLDERNAHVHRKNAEAQETAARERRCTFDELSAPDRSFCHQI